MKIIVLKDIEGLGALGDEIEVKDGYARNYLIPKKLVMEATEGAVRVLAQKKLQKERVDKKLREECLVFADMISGVSCTFSMVSGEEDHLFGSVTSEMIAEQLAAEGVEVDKKQIVLEEPIKSLGVFNVEIKLHSDVKAEARIWVVKK